MPAQSEELIHDPLQRPIRVMVVDDAVVVRGLISRWLLDEGGFEIVATCRSAVEALDLLPTTSPDVLILDIEMPDLDGLTALPLLLEIKPDVAVIVASSLAARHADLALRCLERGALDFIAKPTSNRDFSTSLDFRTDLILRIRALGQRALRRAPAPLAHLQAAPRPAPASPAHKPTSPGAGSVLALRMAAARAVAARTDAALAPAPPAPRLPIIPVPNAPPRMPDAVVAQPRAQRRPGVVAIGASTGGPNAIMSLLGQIKPVIRRLPIVVVQHMPPTFTPIFADHLRRQIGIDAREVRDQELVIPGQVHVAPGGRHLRLDAGRGGVRAALDDGPPVNYCKPSVDILFQSAAETMGPTVIGIVLTGMGSDGTGGAQAIHRAGGTIFVQDEASSVVWGMPGSVYRTGIAQGIGTVTEIAQMLSRFLGAEAA